MYKTKPIQYSTSPYRQSNLYQTPNSSRYSSPIYPSHKTLVSQEDNTSQNLIKPQTPLFSSTSEPSLKIVHKQGPLNQSSFADLKPKLSYDLTFSNSSTKNVGLDSQELQTTSRKNKSIYSRTDISTCISVSELRGFPEQFSQNSHRIPTDVNSYGEVSSRLSFHSSPLQSYPSKKGITTTSYPNKLFLSDESPSTEFRDNIHNFPHTTNNIRGAKISFLQKGDLQTNSNNFLVSKAQEGKKVEPFMKSQSIDFAQMRPFKETLFDMNIINSLLSFLDSNEVLHFQGLCYEFRNGEKFRKVFKKRLEKLALKPLNKEDQYTFWNNIVGFRRLRNKHPVAFTQHFVRKCEYIGDITKDLDRTFPDYEKFTTAKGKDGLLKVLVAIANTVKEVGYIQGLNSIAGVFLFCLKEEESFWMMLYLLERLKVKEIFKSDFERVSILNYQFEIFVNNYLPEITNHFKQQGMSLSYISNQWFITLYSHFLDIPVIIKVWNMMFVRGFLFLIQFALAILNKYQGTTIYFFISHQIAALLTMSIDEIGDYMKSKLREVNEHEEDLFENALRFKVTKRLLKQLEDFYHRGKPNLKLEFDQYNKGKWILESGLYPKLNKEKSVSPNKSQRPPPKNIQGPLINRSRSSKGSTTFREIDSQEKQPILQNFVNTFTANIPDKIKNIFGKRRIFTNLDEAQPGLGEKTPNSLNDIDRNKDKFYSGSLYPHPFKFNENRFNPAGSRRHSSGVILQSQETTNRERKPLSSFYDSKQAQVLNNIKNISPQSLKGSLVEIEKEILDSVRIKPANTITVVKKSVYNNPFDSFTSRESLPTYPSVKRLNLTKNESSIDFSDLNLSNETNSNKQFGLAYASSIQSARRYSGSSHNTSIFQEEFKIMQKSKNNLDDVNVKSSFSSTLNVGSREVREYSLDLSKVYRHPSFGNSAEHTPYFPTTTNSPLTEELQSSKGQSACENNRKEARKFF